MQRQIVSARVNGDCAQIIKRHRADAVWRHAHPSLARRANIWDRSAQTIRVGEEVVNLRGDESCLARIVGLLPTGAYVCSSKQRNPYTKFSGRAQNLKSEQVPVFVRSPVGRMVQVVKLANGGDSRKEHFKKGHPRGMIDCVR